MVRLAALILCAASFSLGQATGFLSEPSIHGSKLVFTAEGDLWMANAKTGDAWRITSDAGTEDAAHFSPDGSQIAFSACYDGGVDVYVMPTDGGKPRRITYDPSDPNSQVGAVVLGWTPNGSRILYKTSAYIYAPKWQRQMTQELYTVPVDGGLPTRLPIPTGAFASYKADGQVLAYVPSTSSWMNWFRYQGGQADEVWLTDLRTQSFTKLSRSKSVDTEPIWVGKTLYFISERTGVRNLWKLNEAGAQAQQVTFFKDAPVKSPSTDGRRIVFQLGPRLAIYDPATNSTQVLDIHLHSDRIHTRAFDQPLRPSDSDRLGPTGNSLSPSGERVALSPRGHLVTVAVEEGAMHTLVSDSAQRVQNPVWAPDGKSIAYLSDASGEEQLYSIEDREGAKPKQITRNLTGQHGTPVWSGDGQRLLIGDRGGRIQLVDVATGEVKTIATDLGPWTGGHVENDFTFSPDGKWVAYSASLGWRLSCVSLYEIASGKTVHVSNPNIDSYSPVFSPDGKYLFVLQDRSISQAWNGVSGRMSQAYATQVTGFSLARGTRSSFEDKGKASGIEVDGLGERSFDLRLAPGQYSHLFAFDGHLAVQTDSGVMILDTSSGKTTTPSKEGNLVNLSGDGKKALLDTNGGFLVVDTSKGEVTPIKLDGLTITIDPEKEWRQVFYEIWRVWRDLFYDPGMHGVDWQAIKAKYEKQLPLVGCRHDLLLLTRDMISELSVGHSFAGAWPDVEVRKSKVGLLGADLQWDPAARAYRIAHILKGDAWDPDERSPLAGVGLEIREGDYLLRIGGEELRPDQNPAALLLGTAGREVEIAVSSTRGLDKARTYTIKPLASDANLRLKDWIESRRAYVAKASGGQIAYVYLGDMSGEGATRYAQQYYPNVESPGIVFDIRGNDGGNISGNLLSDLSSRAYAFFAYRTGANYRRESWAPLGHLAAVTDEWAFSDADYFSDGFQRLKIGPLIGHRTAGAVVGPAIYRLVDGSGIGVPNYGAWVGREWIVEGKGVTPDFEVDQDPASVLAGKDPQLDKAIQVLLDRIKAQPVTQPKHPTYPKKKGGMLGLLGQNPEAW